MCAVTHTFRRSTMTYENEKPDTVSTHITEPPKRENILLNWILVAVFIGVIFLVAKYLPYIL